MNFQRLIFKEPWLAPVILNIESIIKTDSIKEIGITPNGKALLYNEKYWKKLSEAEKLAVQIHELLHIVNLHTKRIGERDKNIWNIACDMALNYQIQASGYQLPQGAIFGENASAEELYKMLEEIKLDNSSNGKTLFFNSQNEIKERELSNDLLSNNLDGTNTSENAETDEAVKNSISLIGKGSTDFSKFYIPKKSKVNWQSKFSNLIKSTLGDEYDYLDYEFDELGVCDDILSRKPTAKICALVDESGSIDDNEYSKFIGELKQMSKFAEISICGFTDEDSFYPIDIKKYHRTKIGGTDVIPTYQRACEYGFDLIVILTDGYLIFPKNEPITTIWVMPKTHSRKYEVII